MLGGHRVGDALEVGGSVVHGVPGREPSHGPHEPELARPIRVLEPRPQVEHGPERAGASRIHEPRGHDADDGGRLAVDPNHASDDGGVAAERLAPRVVAEHDHAGRSGLAIGLPERPA